jgi:2-amino-4-hydroxy-6-hydroxymethyldihydropteridine diphosphokinase
VTRAFIGLGSNLGDREGTIRKAASLLGPHRLSSLLETEPWGYADQPRFVNAVAEIDTGLTPGVLLQRLLAIEAGLGRTREGARYGPRTIDLDLLLYGDAAVDEPGLTVPHPRLHERLFVLRPLLELDPGLVVPGRGPVAALAARLQSVP